ncbi:MAG: CpXC domain-containing protein [Oscillospiraceae bacterium]|nr:CpXC domain-containing protein [Oscillospiraceae bacterium]
MSLSSEITVTCPVCQNNYPFRIWISINTEENPELKKAIQDRSAFLFKCPDCGAKSYIDYGFLYHDMENRIMLYYADSKESAEETYLMFIGRARAGIAQIFQEKKYLIRIVRSQNELLEKVAIFDAGLDDRIIEICKVFILGSIQDQDPDAKGIKILYFWESGKNFFRVLSNGKPYAESEILPEMYEEIQKEYGGRIPDIRSDDLFIDRKWAYRIMGLKK